MSEHRRHETRCYKCRWVSDSIQNYEQMRLLVIAVVTDDDDDDDDDDNATTLQTVRPTQATRLMSRHFFLWRYVKKHRCKNQRRQVAGRL
jgi:hypothetical protein